MGYDRQADFGTPEVRSSSTVTLTIDGRAVTVPAGTSVIDAAGKFVTPGIIDAHSHTMLDSINEGAFSVTSMTGTDDMLNPSDIAIYRALAGGVTAAIPASNAP